MTLKYKLNCNGQMFSCMSGRKGPVYDPGSNTWMNMYFGISQYSQLQYCMLRTDKSQLLRLRIGEHHDNVNYMNCLSMKRA